jgi:predicted hydrocarbon binding protein
MEQSDPAYFYPNRMGRIIFLAMEEILGQSGTNAVLNLANLSEFIKNYPADDPQRAFPFVVIGRLQAAMEAYYGKHGGQGAALRIGRVCFQTGRRMYSPQLSLGSLAFRLMPLQTRLQVGANRLAEIFNQQTDQKIHLEFKDEVILWKTNNCPLCWERQTESPACHLTVGFLQEALDWISSGKYFSVNEISCMANGASACTIAIHRMPTS